MSRLDAIKQEIEDKDKPAYFGGSQKQFIVPKYPVWKAKADDNYINILPPREADRYFGMTVQIHYRVGANNDSFLCPRKMWGKKCPMCELQGRMLRSQGGEHTDESKKLFPTARMVFMIVDTSTQTEAEKGIQVFPAPMDQVNKKGIVPLCEAKRGDQSHKDVSDPELRLDVAFKREGTDRTQTRYYNFGLVKSQDWYKVEDYLDDRPAKFEDILIVPTYDEIKQAMGEEEEATSTGNGRSRVDASSEAKDPSDDRGRLPEGDVPIDTQGPPANEQESAPPKREEAPKTDERKDARERLRNRVSGGLDGYDDRR